MKWLTQKEIQVAAKKGRRPALECSIEHWRQLAGATEAELQKGSKSNRISIGTGRCALCVRAWGEDDEDCPECPLDEAGVSCLIDSSQYQRVSHTGFMSAYNINYLKESVYPAFHREAKKMLKVLKDVHKKLYRR